LKSETLLWSRLRQGISRRAEALRNQGDGPSLNFMS